MQVGGVCYVVNSFAWLLSPAWSAVLFPSILLPALVAELSVSIWLLTYGLSPSNWAGRKAPAAA